MKGRLTIAVAFCCSGLLHGAVLSPVANGEVFDGTPAGPGGSDSITITTTPDTIAGELLSFDQWAVFEFDLTPFAGQTLTLAELTFTATPNVGTPTISFDHYEGDGVLSTGDSSELSLATTSLLSTPGTHTVDVSGTVGPLLISATHVGFRFLENGPTGAGQSVAVTGVTLEVEAVPEPSMLWMSVLALFLAARRRRFSE